MSLNDDCYIHIMTWYLHNFLQEVVSQGTGTPKIMVFLLMLQSRASMKTVNVLTRSSTSSSVTSSPAATDIIAFVMACFYFIITFYRQ